MTAFFTLKQFSQKTMKFSAVNSLFFISIDYIPRKTLPIMSGQEPLLREGTESWGCTVNGVAATLALSPDGDVDIQVAAGDVVGATLGAARGIQIWHMPLRHPSSVKPSRELRKTPVIQFPTPAAAEAAIAAIRRFCAGAHPARRVVAIINPASGRGAGPKLFSRHVKPILVAAGLHITEHTTTAPGHATKILQSTQPGDMDIVLAIGGDGTTFEVLQGVLQRPDWDAMRKIALVQVPCGSGNALAASTELWDVPTAAHAIVKGETGPLDVASVVQPATQRYYSFLSFTYGVISSLDIGTEHLRWMGSNRFVVGALSQIMKQQVFNLRLAFLEAEAAEQLPPGGAAPAADDGGVREDGDGASTPPASESTSLLIEGKKESVGRNTAAAATWLASAVQGHGPPMRHLSTFLPAATAAPADGDTPPPSQSLPAAAALPPSQPPLQQQLPAGWHWLPTDRVQLFAACNLPRLDMNSLFAPGCTPSNGLMDIIFTAGRVGRWRGLEMMGALDKGEHLALEYVQRRQARAVWMEPQSHGTTWLVVDGEQVPETQLYAEVHPGLCHVVRAPSPPSKVSSTATPAAAAATE